MTSTELRGNLIDWIKGVLNIEQGLNVQVITSHQNSPQPRGVFITVPYMVSRATFGTASRGEVGEDGTRCNITDNQLSVEIRETNGEGETLNELIKSLEREDVIANYFTQRGLVYYNHTNITPVPRLNQQEWVREALVELSLGVAEVTTEDTSYIEIVEYNINT